MSRSLKPIPSKYVQAQFGHLEHWDGELIVGEPTSKTAYRDTVSAVMAHDKQDFDVRFYAFDHISHPSDPYHTRADRLRNDTRADRLRNVILHEQHAIHDLDGLLGLEQYMLDIGYEGLILRDHIAPYKFGRATAKQGWLLKMKRFVDAEAIVVGFEERMRNDNEATTDALGHTVRSTHAANKVGHGDLGALICDFEGHRVAIGTGFTAGERVDIWAARSQALGSVAKFKYFDYGTKDAPRHPVFLGWRDRIDL
jgi:DNA ligase-1